MSNRLMFVLPGLSEYNKALHQAAFPLRFIAVGEFGLYVTK
jgi:hypothetical protein